jgi:hypothetical protein
VFKFHYPRNEGIALNRKGARGKGMAETDAIVAVDANADQGVQALPDSKELVRSGTSDVASKSDDIATKTKKRKRRPARVQRETKLSEEETAQAQTG